MALSPLARHVLHGVWLCETSTKHPSLARGNFIPILKITRDELPMDRVCMGDAFSVPFILSCDYTLAADVFSSCSSIPRAHFETSFRVKLHVFSTSSNFKSKSCGENEAKYLFRCYFTCHAQNIAKFHRFYLI